MQEILLKLIDIIKDTNKTISMRIDNPNSKSVEEACFHVCMAVSKDLELLERAVKEMEVI